MPPASATPTPISFGANIAGLGCASAFVVQNGISEPVAGSSNPAAAIDGSTSTAWESGVVPSSGTQVNWVWQLYEPGQSPCEISTAGQGLADSADQINAFQLIPEQATAGPSTHELWLYRDVGCTVNLKSDSTAYFTWQLFTTDGQILPLKIEPPVAARCVVVRTLADPSAVAWREIQIYQELPPPFGFATATPTGTATPSATIVPTSSNTTTPTGTNTANPLPTSTPTLTPLPAFAGQNVAPYAAIYSSSGGPATCTPTLIPAGTPSANPCAAIDINLATFWAPPGGSSDPQGLTLQLPSSAYSPATDTVADIRVMIQSAGTGGSEVYQVAHDGTPVSCSPAPPAGGYPDGTQLDCPIPSPTPGVASVSVLMFHNGTEDGSYGIREVQVYKLVGAISTLTVTSTATVTPTASSTTTATATITPTPTVTPTATPTPTMTPTFTVTPTPTMTPTSTGVLPRTRPASPVPVRGGGILSSLGLGRTPSD